MWQRASRFFAEDWKYYHSSTAKKPLVKQARELYLLYKYYRFFPYQYIKHCLYLESFNGDIYDYIPPELLHRLQRSLNPPDHIVNVTNKDQFSAIMAEAHLPIIKQLFTIKPGPLILNNDRRAVSFIDFISFLNNYDAHSAFVIKPVSGYQGLSIYKFTIRDGVLWVKEKGVNEQELHRLLFQKSEFTEYLVQPLVKQHDLLTRIYPSSVNTVRIDTLILNNEVVNNGAVLRLGNSGMFVDNWAKGGLIVPIDLKTGRLGQFGKTKTKYGRGCFKKHPSTAFQFHGTQLPFWTEVLDTVRSAALRLSPLRLLGWDVAITNDGPLLIEANQDYDVFLTQEAIGGLRQTPIGREIISGLER